MTEQGRDELKRRLDRAPRNSAGRRQFGDPIRSEVVEYVRARVAEGASRSEATRELGLGQRTVWGWLQAKPLSMVREVEVLEPQAVDANSTKTFELRFDNGAVVRGLDLDDIAKLLRSNP